MRRKFSVFSFQFSAASNSVLSTQYSVSGRRSRFTLPPSPSTSRNGLSLVEVLAAVGVLSIGLLGMAALLPLGRLAISESMRNDRVADCGRAALHDIRIRRFLDPAMISGNYPVTANYPLTSYIIDPRGVANGLGNFGTSKRVTLTVGLGGPMMTGPQADSIFMASDDLSVSMPEDQLATSTSAALPVGVRSSLLITNTATLALASQGNYSWFLTVTPWPTDPVYSNSSPPSTYPYKYTVSVVVCDRRNVGNTTPAGSERVLPIKQFLGAAGGVALGGGSIQLDRTINDTDADKAASSLAGIKVHENDWVALCNANGLCQWYQVASISEDDPNNPTCYMTLNGPDWVISNSDKLVAIGTRVAGVYTTTVVLDQEPGWKN